MNWRNIADKIAKTAIITELTSHFVHWCLRVEPLELRALVTAAAGRKFSDAAGAGLDDVWLRNTLICALKRELV